MGRGRDGRLNVDEVVADGASPERWLGVLHGILGSGRNWASVIRQVVRSRPEWGALLVDLRQHGKSQGFPPPHTVERTAADLATLERAQALRALVGHSFGGKVALLRARDDQRIEQVWVMDSSPGTGGLDAGPRSLIRLLRRLPAAYPDRDSAVAGLVEAGVARPVALWLGTNLVRRGGEYHWRLDLDDMDALLDDFFQVDLWGMVEEPRPGLTLHFVRATGSPVLDVEAVSRIREVGVRTGRVFLHEVQGSHWLNADARDRVVSLLERGLD